MSQTFDQKTEDRLTAIQQRTGMGRQDVLKELETQVSKFKDDPQLSDPTSLYNYGSAVLWAKYVNRMQVKDTEIIPVGFESLRKTKAGKIMSALYVVAREGPKTSFRRVSLPAVVADIYRKVNCLSNTGAYKYNVKLGTYGNTPGADFAADDRSIFESPTPIKLTPEAFRKMFNIPMITIEEAPNSPSKVTSTNNIIRTDWKCIRGVIAGSSIFKRKDSELEGAVCRIIDRTTPMDTYITREGKKIESTFSMWTAPEFALWEDQSECDFYGTIQVDPKEHSASGNAYLVIPVRATKRPVEA